MKYLLLLMMATSLCMVSCSKDDDGNDDVVATCTDGIQNQDETGVDCGGVCPACTAAATCSDNIQNQGETGVDCGGPCPACPECVTCTSPTLNSNVFNYCRADFASDSAYQAQIATVESGPNNYTCN